jgi:hypothetical protein
MTETPLETQNVQGSNPSRIIRWRRQIRSERFRKKHDPFKGSGQNGHRQMADTTYETDIEAEHRTRATSHEQQNDLDAAGWHFSIQRLRGVSLTDQVPEKFCPENIALVILGQISCFLWSRNPAGRLSHPPKKHAQLRDMRDF